MIEEFERFLKVILILLGFYSEDFVTKTLVTTLTNIIVFGTFTTYISILGLVFRKGTYQTWWNDKGEIDKIILSFGLGILNFIISLLFTFIALIDMLCVFIFSPYIYAFNYSAANIVLPLFLISYLIQLVLFTFTNENGLMKTFLKWGKFLIRKLSFLITLLGSLFIFDALRYTSSYSLWLNNFLNGVLFPILLGILFMACGLKLYVKYK